MRLKPFIRTIDLVLLVGLIGIVTWTFKVKHDSQEALDRVAELEKQIAAERIEIDLLKSDWSLLTSPARLQDLAERYSSELDLMPLEAFQLSGPDELPALRVPDLGNGITDEQQAGIDNGARTGSVPVSPDVKASGAEQ